MSKIGDSVTGKKSNATQPIKIHNNGNHDKPEVSFMKIPA